MFNRKLFFNSIVITLLSIVLAACGDKFETVSGYTPEKFNKKRMDKQLKETIENMVFVKGGSFMMGCLDSENSLEPLVLKYIGSKRATKQHFFFDSPVMPCKPENKVTLDSFSIGKFEVSYGEYDLFTQEASLPFLRENKFHTQGEHRHAKDRDSREGEKPANTGWHQANRYCKWLAKKTDLPFALPTEAQWEYAARSRGLNVPYATDTGYWNQGINYPKFDEDEDTGMTAKNMKYPPNPLGIYHMSDLMTEWVQDWYDKNYYSYSPEKNPKGPDSGTEKVLKGGGKGGSIQHTPVWSRHPEPPLWDKEWMDIKIKAKESGRNIELNKENPTSYSYGFRCALNLSKPSTFEEIKTNK